MKARLQNAQIWRVKFLGTLLALGGIQPVAYGQLFGGGPGGGLQPGGAQPGVSTPAGTEGEGGSGGMGGPGMMGGPMMGSGGGGMGGMGGGMGGLGGMEGGMGAMGMGMPGGMYSTPAGPLVVWQKPQGEQPQWLVTGNNAIQANEMVRRNLETANECDFTETPLQQAILELLDKAKVAYSINNQDVESAGHSPDIAVTLSGKGPTRELLRRLLTPLDLGYIVREDYIEITSMDMVDNDPVLRTYDLAHVMSNNQGLNELLLCIQTTIEPDVWGGGNASLSPLGSLLVVRAPENVQHEISKLLVIRSQQPQGAGEAGGQSSNKNQFSPDTIPLTPGSGLPAPANSNPVLDSVAPGGLPLNTSPSPLGGENPNPGSVAPPGGATRGGGSSDY